MVSGDSQTSRRLPEALLGGCIPVRLLLHWKVAGAEDAGAGCPPLAALTQLNHKGVFGMPNIGMLACLEVQLEHAATPGPALSSRLGSTLANLCVP